MTTIRNAVLRATCSISPWAMTISFTAIVTTGVCA